MGAEVRIRPIRTAALPIPAAYALRPRGGPLARAAALARRRGGVLRAGCLAFVLEHPDEGPLLVDTGFHADALRDPARDLGRAMALLFRDLRPVAPFDLLLREAGVDPGEVGRVVMTHLHVDHTSGMRLLPNARFICSAAEWRAARGRGATARGYRSEHLPAEERMDIVDLDLDGLPRDGFERTLDLLGDGSVVLVSTPGHTPGHLSVAVRAEGGRTVLLAGDAVYTVENLLQERPPLVTIDRERYMRSLREIASFMRAGPAALVVPSHDPAAWRALARMPVAADSMGP